MIIKNGIVADPASGLYEQMDILVKDGIIVKIAPDISCTSDTAATEKEKIIDEMCIRDSCMAIPIASERAAALVIVVGPDIQLA